ncbi:hemerythrin domain-containing protein [Novosphingobium sp.]|uniref:hemerythrin domain-containing protein n=1 Tax=Novosphingobium sp. TaxID=1874826 RepID=UPI00262CDFF5|nr:hemerythrin domain-containing protein [Novosphingobium sp.]
MPPKPKDAVTMLKAEHRAVEDLFEAFEVAKTKPKQKTLAMQICAELIIHATIEEEIFYPALRGKIDDDTLDEAYVEHDGAKLMISQLMAGQPDEAFFAAKVTVLSEEIKHHVKEEEMSREGMFAQAAAADVDLVALAEQMAARRAELEAMIKAQGLPTPVSRTLSPPELTIGEPVA